MPGAPIPNPLASLSTSVPAGASVQPPRSLALTATTMFRTALRTSVRSPCLVARLCVLLTPPAVRRSPRARSCARGGALPVCGFRRAPVPERRRTREAPAGGLLHPRRALHEGQPRGTPVRLLACSGAGAGHPRCAPGEAEDVRRLGGQRAAAEHQGVLVCGLIARSQVYSADIYTSSDWPTIPQLYVNGEFVGGCDILINSTSYPPSPPSYGIERVACSAPVGGARRIARQEWCYSTGGGPTRSSSPASVKFTYRGCVDVFSDMLTPCSLYLYAMLIDCLWNAPWVHKWRIGRAVPYVYSGAYSTTPPASILPLLTFSPFARSRSSTVLSFPSSVLSLNHPR